MAGEHTITYMGVHRRSKARAFGQMDRQVEQAALDFAIRCLSSEKLQSVLADVSSTNGVCSPEWCLGINIKLDGLNSLGGKLPEIQTLDGFVEESSHTGIVFQCALRRGPGKLKMLPVLYCGTTTYTDSGLLNYFVLPKQGKGQPLHKIAGISASEIPVIKLLVCLPVCPSEAGAREGYFSSNFNFHLWGRQNIPFTATAVVGNQYRGNMGWSRPVFVGSRSFEKLMLRRDAFTSFTHFEHALPTEDFCGIRDVHSPRGRFLFLVRQGELFIPGNTADSNLRAISRVSYQAKVKTDSFPIIIDARVLSVHPSGKDLGLNLTCTGHVISLK